MLTLAIESSSPVGSVAIVRDERVLAYRWHDTPNAHAERLLPLIEQALSEAGVDRSALNRVAVGLGPGSFTGLRVGIALAQGIATGLDLPLVGVPSLAALALAGAAHCEAPLLGALLDARRGEYFFAVFDREARPVVPARVLPQAGVAGQIEQLLDGRMACIVGEAAKAVLPESWTAATQTVVWPDARQTALLAASHLAQSAEAPIYLRDADAKLPNLPPNPLAVPRS